MNEAMIKKIEQEAERKYPKPNAYSFNFSHAGMARIWADGAKRGYELAMEEAKKILERAYQDGAIDSACDEANFNLWYFINFEENKPPKP